MGLGKMTTQTWRHKPVFKVPRSAIFVSFAALFSAHSITASAQWSTEKDAGGAHISTSSESGGMLSSMCLLSHGRCQWAVVMPESDCKVGSYIPVSIKGRHGTLIVSALCGGMPKIGIMPGSGRLILMDAPSSMIEAAVSTQDATISTRTSNGRFVSYAFQSQGAAAAISEAGNWMRSLYNQTSSPSIYPPRNEYIGNTEAVLRERNP